MGWNFLGVPGPPSTNTVTPEQYLAGIARAAEQRSEAAQAAVKAAQKCAYCTNGMSASYCWCPEPCDSPDCAALPENYLSGLPGTLRLIYPVPEFKVAV